MKWYAFMVAAFITGGIGGALTGAWIIVRSSTPHAINNLAGVFAASAAPLGEIDAPLAGNLDAWHAVWSSAATNASIAAMQFEQIGPQWRREMFRATERLEHAAPFLVEAGVPIGIRSRRLRQCILRGRTDPQADVGGCARREYESSPPPAPRSPAEKLVDALAAHRDGQRGTQPHAELWVNGAAGANAQDDIITAALAWSELRPFFRERLVGVTSFFERQSRTSASRKGSTHDGDSHAAARRCILAAQLELDSDVPSCVRDATSGGDLEFVATGNSPRRDRMFAR